MKQLGLAFTQYAQDYDETTPGGGAMTTLTGRGWAACLYPYTKTVQVYTCPSDPTEIVAGQRASFAVLSYAYNSNLVSGSKPKLMSQLTAPSQTVALFEMQNLAASLSGGGINPNDTYSCEANEDTAYQPSCPNMNGLTTDPITTCTYATMPMWNPITSAVNANYYRVQGRHAGGAVYLAADGHAKWLAGTNVSNGTVPGTTNDPAAYFDSRNATGVTFMNNHAKTATFQLTFSWL